MCLQQIWRETDAELVLQFLDGATLLSVATLNKIVRKMVENETHIFTVDNPRFIFGEGLQA